MIVADKFAHNLSLSFVVRDNLPDSGNIYKHFVWNFKPCLKYGKSWKKTILILPRVGMKFELRTTLTL